MTRRESKRAPRIAFSTRLTPPPELDDADHVLALLRAAAAMATCAPCGGAGRITVESGRRRNCPACDGTGSPGVLADRTLRRWAPVCLATLARVIHHQRPALPMPGLDAGSGR